MSILITNHNIIIKPSNIDYSFFSFKFIIQ